MSSVIENLGGSLKLFDPPLERSGAIPQIHRVVLVAALGGKLVSFTDQVVRGPAVRANSGLPTPMRERSVGSFEDVFHSVSYVKKMP